jgi:Tfp pilus assembly protein PilF
MTSDFPFAVIKSHACHASKISIIFDSGEGVRRDNDSLKVGYKKNPYINGNLTDECRQFLIDLQKQGRLPNRLIFGPEPEDKHFYFGPESESQTKKTHFITPIDFLEKKEVVLIDDYPDNQGRKVYVKIKRTEYGSYLLYFRYCYSDSISTPCTEQYISEGDLTSVVRISNERFKRQDKVQNKNPDLKIRSGVPTFDNYAVVKLFESKSGIRWYATFQEKINEVSSQNDSFLKKIIPSTSFQYFGVIRRSKSDKWDFWDQKDLDPGIKIGEIKELNLHDVELFGSTPQIDKKENPDSEIGKQEKIQRIKQEGHRMSDEPGDWKYIPAHEIQKTIPCESSDQDIKGEPEPNQEALKWVKIGQTLENEEKYQEAITAFYKALDYDHNCSTAYWGLWHSYSQLGNPYESKDAYYQAIAIDDRNAAEKQTDEDKRKAEDPELLKRSIQANFDSGNWTSALETCEKYISLYPSVAEIWFIKGCCFFEKMEYDKAIVSFQKTVEINPHHYYAFNDLGVSLGKIGKNNAATDAFDKALSNVPSGMFESGLIQSNLQTSKILPEGRVQDNLIFLE